MARVLAKKEMISRRPYRITQPCSVIQQFTQYNNSIFFWIIIINLRAWGRVNLKLTLLEIVVWGRTKRAQTKHATMNCTKCIKRECVHCTILNYIIWFKLILNNKLMRASRIQFCFVCCNYIYLPCNMLPIKMQCPLDQYTLHIYIYKIIHGKIIFIYMCVCIIARIEEYSNKLTILYCNIFGVCYCCAGATQIHFIVISQL